MSQFGALWQPVSSTAVDAAEMESGTATDGYVLTADGAGGAAWETPIRDAADLTSGTAADGYVLTADGSGGSAWEAASGGGDAADLTSGTATDGYVLTADGIGGAAWEVAPETVTRAQLHAIALSF